MSRRGTVLTSGSSAQRRLVVRLDRRRVLGDRELEPHVRVEMAVGHVVRDLPDRPAAGTIGRLELRVGEAGDSRPKRRGRRRDLGDAARAVLVGARTAPGELPDRIGEVAHPFRPFP